MQRSAWPIYDREWKCKQQNIDRGKPINSETWARIRICLQNYSRNHNKTILIRMRQSAWFQTETNPSWSDRARQPLKSIHMRFAANN